ncbi:arsenic resistance N-acetyltransferase ArsN2 [Azospira oryzae]|uniref:arsenic resistance N-acetyltransferase ArsN2 n=1 Tax=Azospira oryzae TaxID=146939 RepID=UPI0019637B24|nr:arsenic resistance N-acetyltransferase ArsN2 [Azospira oryzae]
MSAAADFRRGGEPDLESVRALLQACGLAADDLGPDLMPAFRLYRRGQELLACGAMEYRQQAALLRSLAVRPEARGTGLAKALVGPLEAEAAQAGITDVYLLTTTARDWFAARSYSVAPRSQAPAGIAAHAQFRSTCPSSAVLMHKRLPPLA